MRNETTATEANDARYVGFSKQLHALSAAVVFSASEKVSNSLMGSNGVAKSVKQPISEGAEEQDGSPVATHGMDLFRFMAEAAVDQGHLSSDGFNHVMAALERDAQ
jgi:hypothetical protein